MGVVDHHLWGNRAVIMNRFNQFRSCKKYHIMFDLFYRSFSFDRIQCHTLHVATESVILRSLQMFNICASWI